MEIQSAFSLYLQNNLESFNWNLNLWFNTNFNRNIVTHLNLKHDICKLQLLIFTYYLQILKYDMKLKLTLRMLFNKSSCSMIWPTWSRVFFETRILVYKLYTVFLLNLLRPNYNFIYLWQKLTIQLGSSTREIISWKSHVVIYMTSSVDPIYQGESENESFQTIPYHKIWG